MTKIHHQQLGLNPPHTWRSENKIVASRRSTIREFVKAEHISTCLNLFKHVTIGGEHLS